MSNINEEDVERTSATRLLSYTLVDICKRNKVEISPTQAYVVIVQLFATIGYYLHNNPTKTLDTKYFELKNPKDGKNLFRVFMKGAGTQSYEGQKIDEFLARIFKPKKKNIKMEQLNELFEEYISELIETSTLGEVKSAQSINKLYVQQMVKDKNSDLTD